LCLKYVTLISTYGICKKHILLKKHTYLYRNYILIVYINIYINMYKGIFFKSYLYPYICENRTHRIYLHSRVLDSFELELLRAKTSSKTAIRPCHPETTDAILCYSFSRRAHTVEFRTFGVYCNIVHRVRLNRYKRLP
jgi:hypothetical protein